MKTKAELVKRVYDYIKTGKGKEIVDPDPHQIYSRRKEKQTMSSDLSNDGEESVEFPSTGWGSSLEKMPIFMRVEMNSFVMKSGKAIANKDHHTVRTGLIKMTNILKRLNVLVIRSTFSSKASVVIVSERVNPHII